MLFLTLPPCGLSSIRERAIRSRTSSGTFETSVAYAKPSSTGRLTWQTSALEARVDGTLQAGATGVIVRKFLGRRMESSVEFDETSRQGSSRSTTSGPVQFRIQHTYEPTDEGARITVVMEGEADGFFRLAEPLVQRAIHREMEANFATLKDILESDSA